MTTEMACSYLTLSEASLRYLANHHGLSPVDCAGLTVTRWRQSDLDRLVAALPAKRPKGSSIPASTKDPALEALRKAAKRTRKRS